jgi:hypothetical protein
MQASYRVPMQNENQRRAKGSDFRQKDKKRKPDYSEQRRAKRGD